MYKKYILFALLSAASTPIFAQKANVQGIVRNQLSKEPFSNVRLVFEKNQKTVVTDSKGNFNLPKLNSGEETILITGGNIQETKITVQIPTSGLLKMEDIYVLPSTDNDNMVQLSMAADDLLDDDNESFDQNISAKIILSNDVYVNKIGYQLSQFRFRLRGYNNRYEQKYINGVHFNDQLRGVFNYASIGAINDLTRNGDEDNAMDASTFTFGSIGGSENINMRASTFAKGAKATATYTNRNYYSRSMLSYSTGLMDNGWAFTGLIGGRYADKGYVEGTFYKNVSYALSIEKQFQQGKHSLSLVTFGSPVERGQQSGSFQEAYDLLDNNLYNPNWGYQDGKIRNSRVVTAYDPTAILSHIWKIDPNTKLTTGISLHYGKYASTALNWYRAKDPRPDYYRNLPSYYTQQEDIDKYTEAWKSKAVSQVDWASLYNQNKEAVMKGELSALYMVEKRHSDLLESSFNSTLNKTINEHSKLTAGIAVKGSQSQQYKTVDDLLGAEYVLDTDKYAEQDFGQGALPAQNNLLNPDFKAREGDTFGYRFNINMKSANAWLQNEYSYSNIDFFYGTQLSYTSFERIGYMKNGRFPNDSYGKGQEHHFVDYAFKGGMTYKFNGRHLLNAKISYQTKAPLANDAYVSPRVSDFTLADLKSAKIFSTDISYIFSLPKLNGRLSVFQTNFTDLISRQSYYNDAARTFINHGLEDMDQIHRGVELGLTYKIDNNWSIDLAATKAEYYYSNNPMGVMNSENGYINGIPATNVRETVYLNNYYVGGMPQTTGTFGLRYFVDYWFFGANVNYAGDMYLAKAPLRQLMSDYSTISPDDAELYEAYQNLTHQEKFKNSATVDLSIGKILYLKDRGKSINFNLAVNNVLNDKNIRTGGYENARLDITAPNKFNSKYYYMQGINCFLNVSYRF
ncbi:TonB-dependent receptor [Sphingobacterium sp. UBA5996]|uniref:TonB-dependent receptor n=1 Tax=Sphingobacterium sp. UBA5996 TaxID=1947505 RepID=UPI0025D9F2FB|nr:TonB-dependent receptor [Sphingobacterium sp. UBA5996]